MEMRTASGKYKIVVEKGDDYLDISAEHNGKTIHINNLNMVLSEVIEPVIPGWEEREEIVEGTAITGTEKELSQVINLLRELARSPYFEKALDEEFIISE